MIYQFSIQAPDCFSRCDPGTGDIASHRRLIRTWAQFMTLYAGEKETLLRLIKSMPTQHQGLWLEALKSCPVIFEPGGSIEALQGEGLAEFVRRHRLSLFIVHPLLREQYSIRKGDVESRVGTATVSTLDAFDESSAVREWRSRHEADIQAGASVEDVFQKRILPFVSDAEFVSVVDRYMLKSSLRAIEHGRQPGVTTLLLGLENARRVRHVELFTSMGDEPKEGLDKLTRYLRSERTKLPASVELRLNVAADSVFQKEAHDRYIRGDRRIINLGIGLDILAGMVVGSRCQSSLSYNYREKLEQESRLARRSTAVRI